jgi:hypothetical protein
MSSVFKQLSDEPPKYKGVNPTPIKFPQSDSHSVKRKLTGLKFFIILTFFISLAALAGSGFIYQSLNNEMRQREALESSQLQLNDKAIALETETTEYRSEIERIQEQLKKYMNERSTITKDLEKSRIEISNLQKKMKFLEDRGKLIANQAVKIPSENFIPETSNESPTFAPVKERIAAEPEEIEKAPEAAAEPAVEPVAEPRAPEVLTVNRKFNFIVTNLGLRDKIKMGDKLKVERDGKKIASAQVEKLYDNFSAANIVEEDKNNPIAEKDSVRKA